MMKKKVAVQSCKKLVYGVQNQLSSASETVPPCISVEDIETLTFMVALSRRRF